MPTPTPTLSLPPTSPCTPLPPLPTELLLSLHQSISPSVRDELDNFVFSDQHRLDDIINNLIPDELSLSQTPSLSLHLRSSIQSLRHSTSILQSSLEKDQHSDKIEHVQVLVGELLTRVTSIRDAATESESIVREITREIQTLDLAKRNLIASMNALKRFQMLVNAFDRLTLLAKSRKYRQVSSALLAVKELSTHFKSYTSVDRIQAVSQGVTSVQLLLRSQVMREFETAFSTSTLRNTPGKTQELQDAALVIQALGEEAKGSLLSWYSLLLLRDYRRIFGGSEAGGLDGLQRRFSWFRRVIKTHEDENEVIFPEEWKVGAVLGGGFAEVTRDDLKTVLAKSKTIPGALTVTILLESIQITKDFEKDLSRKCGLPFEEITSLSAINFGRPPSTKGSLISTVFEPYLGVFVEAQDRAISDLLSSLISSRSSFSSTPSEQHVLPSSTELFYFYREALEKCSELSNKQPLLELVAVFKKWLKVFAEEVLGGGLMKVDRRSSDGGRPNVQELQSACLVLNTAEYCQETTSQLAESLQQNIAPNLRSKVTLEAEKEMFISLISASLLAILHELELSVEGPFNQMLRSPWKDQEFVSSESGYVDEVCKMVRAVVGVVREGVEAKKFLRSVCDKIVGLILAKFTQTIVRCRPIAQIGAEQILLDLQYLKSCLLQLPLAPGDSAPVPMTYARYVTKSVLKIDTLLKVVMTPEDPPEGFINNYLILVPCQSFSDFQKVLDLKGVRRAEQNNLLDLFLARTSTSTGLSDNSFISSLDMDPGAQTLITPPVSGMTSPLGGGGSRAPTPVRGLGDDRGKDAFMRLGQRIGMASRLFGGT